MKRLVVIGKNKKITATVYLVLRVLVIITMILQFLKGNYENVFMCLLTLILFAIPIIIDQKLNIKLPNTSAIGFSMIDILNRKKRKNSLNKLSPLFVAVVAFCFSMTIGVLWEFFEYGMDKTFNMDMQKDRVVSQISSVNLNEEKKNEAVTIKNIEKTQIYGTVNKSPTVITIDNGYLDIGINDTMKDLLVNFVGAVVFSILGLLYIKNRDEYKFTEEFMPMVKTEEEIEETRQELERLEKVLEQKKQRKQHENK